MADERTYQRELMRERRKNGVADRKPAQVGEELSNRPLKHQGRAVEAQLKLLPRDVLERIPALAECLRVLAAVVDHGEPHLHTAAVRELRAGLDRLEQLAPTAKPKSKLDELSERRRAAGA